MKPGLQCTAILLFSRSPGQEAAAKSFCPRHKKANRQIARSLIAHSLKTARASGLPVYYASLQQGHTFGERLCHAIEQVWERGYERVLVIGNDCPSLSVGTLRFAASRLQTLSLVLGPSRDGGLYLIGLDRTAWHAADFCQLPWETPALQQALQAYSARYELPTHWLPPADDIDHAWQLHVLASPQLKHAYLLRSIYGIIVDFSPFFRQQPLLGSKQHDASAIFLRGPPSSSFPS